MKRFNVFFTDYFYIFFVFFAFLSFTFSVPDYLRQFLWVILFLVNIRKVFDSLAAGEDNAIFVFIFLSMISILGSIGHPYPIEFYFTILFNQYIPVIYYFIGKNDNAEHPRFYRCCIIALAFVCVVGFYWLLTSPEWYVTKSLERINQHNYYTESTLEYARFGSYLDSYHISNLGIFMLCASLGGLYYRNDKRSSMVFYWCGVVISIFAVLLARQRVAMYIMPFLLVIFVLLCHKNNKQIYKMVLNLIPFIVVALVFLLSLDVVHFDLVYERFTAQGSENLFSSRDFTWINAINNQRNFIFGHGLGGGGHLASAAGIKPVVVDGSYFNLLLETGIFNALCFLGILVSSLKRAYLWRHIFIVEFLSLIFYMFSLLGANIIDMPYIIAPMWYVLGRINNRNLITT